MKGTERKKSEGQEKEDAEIIKNSRQGRLGIGSIVISPELWNSLFLRGLKSQHGHNLICEK